jgi:Cu+-exporting ATPase
MLVKGGDTLALLKTIKNIVFDKTGTLTTGKLQVEDYVVAENMAQDTFRSVVTSIENHSSHPIAKSITSQWKDTAVIAFTEVDEVKGKGMEAKDEAGNLWQLGSERWLNDKDTNAGYDLYLYKNKEYVGALRIADALRVDAVATIAELKRMGYKTILLSGDKKEKCERIAQQLGIEEVYAEQSPEQKNAKLDELLKQAPTAMVGDGINDAPALAKATVGISLSESTQIAIQSANIILSNNQLSTLPRAIRLGIYTDQTIKQNLFWAFLYNVIAIPVAAAGFLKPTYGAGIMALSDVVLIINSLRLGIRNIKR